MPYSIRSSFPEQNFTGVGNVSLFANVHGILNPPQSRFDHHAGIALAFRANDEQAQAYIMQPHLSSNISLGRRVVQLENGETKGERTLYYGILRSMCPVFSSEVFAVASLICSYASGGFWELTTLPGPFHPGYGFVDVVWARHMFHKMRTTQPRHNVQGQ